MGAFIDLAGQRFGKLTVLKRSERSAYSKHSEKPRWDCVCDCGRHTVVWSASLRNGDTKSCGCLQRQFMTKRNTKHGLSKTRLYAIWKGMIHRCYHSNSGDYMYYGERGISICGEWRNDFMAFHDWALLHGYADDLTIERVDNDGNYCPENCRWEALKQQANNKRNSRFLVYNNMEMTCSQWSEMLGISKPTLYSRLSRKWTIAEAIETPIGGARCRP